MVRGGQEEEQQSKASVGTEVPQPPFSVWVCPQYTHLLISDSKQSVVVARVSHKPARIQGVRL